LKDIRGARSRLVIASAWFTDTNLANAFLQNPTTTKFALLNRSDLKRNGGSKAANSLIKANLAFPLGSENWEEGVMHHKWIIADDVVWVGSYNFTFQARKNFETLLRISDTDTASIFFQEAVTLQEDVIARDFGLQRIQTAGNKARAAISGLTDSDLYPNGAHFTCKPCGRGFRVDDPSVYAFAMGTSEWLYECYSCHGNHCSICHSGSRADLLMIDTSEMACASCYDLVYDRGCCGFSQWSADELKEVGGSFDLADMGMCSACVDRREAPCL